MNDQNSPEWPEQPPADLSGANDNLGQAADRMAELEAEAARYKDQALRAMADTENMRKRAEREREDAAKYGVSQLARDLLPVADNLRRAIESVGAEAQQDPAVAGLVTGIEATERELMTALERRGIKRIDPTGQKFDPNFHQAVFEVPTNDQPPGTVVQVLQSGYVIHDRLLRPAMVGVAKSAGDAGPERLDTQA